MASVEHRLDAATDQATLLAKVAELNADPAVHGILVQLPLPPQIDSQTVIAAIDPAKDVDGFHVINAGRLMTGGRSEEHTSELQSLMRISYAVFCLKKKKKSRPTIHKLLSTQNKD